MNIKPFEIESIEEIGVFRGRPIKMIKTLGGFYLAVGYLNGSEEALAAGSHPAIVRHNLKKKYKDIFFHMAKSEGFISETAKEYTHLLPKKMADKGYGLYSVKNLNEFSYFLTKYNSEVLKVSLLKGNVSVDTAVENLNKDILESTKNAIEKAIKKDCE